VLQFLVLEDIKHIPDDMYFKYLFGGCGKFIVLDRLVSQLLAANHKVCKVL
jgi:hypothetical protein